MIQLIAPEAWSKTAGRDAPRHSFRDRLADQAVALAVRLEPLALLALLFALWLAMQALKALKAI